MAQQALGMIETRGMVALVEATDAALKAANVEYKGWKQVGSGLVTVVLTGEPHQAGQRAADRGVYSRFHRGGTAARAVEDRLYRDVVHQLREAGDAVLHHEIADEPAEAVTAVILEAVMTRLARRSG